MRITNFSAENFRMLRHMELGDFRGLNVFIGPNATGKSAVLEVLHHLLESEQIGFHRDITFRGSPGASIKFAADVALSDDDARGVVEDVVATTGKAAPPEEIVKEYALGFPRSLTLKYSGVAPRERGQSTQFSKELLVASRPLQDAVQKSLRPAVRNWDAQNLDLPTYAYRSVNRLVSSRTLYLPVQRWVPATLQPGRPEKPTPSEVGRWLHRARVEKLTDFDDYEALVSRLLSHVKGVVFSTGKNDLRWGFGEDGLPEMTPADESSSGTAHLSLFAGAFVFLPKGSVVIAEEPELSLHPGSLRKMMREIHAVADRRAIQFFFTTHSPVVVEGLDPYAKDHALWQLSRNPDGSAGAARCDSEKQIEDAINSLVRT
jgi:predicted ATPase